MRIDEKVLVDKVVDGDLNGNGRNRSKTVLPRSYVSPELSSSTWSAHGHKTMSKTCTWVF